MEEKGVVEDVVVKGIESVSGNFVTSTGEHTLFYQVYRQTGSSNNAPRALAFYLHGLHESLDIFGFERLVSTLVPLGFAVIGFEYHGHGRSSGRRGLIERLEDLQSDALDFVTRISNGGENCPTFSASPFFLIGHSLGGALALMLSTTSLLSQEPRFHGAILLGPFVRNSVAPNRFTICFLQGLLGCCGCCAGSLPLGPSLDPHQDFRVDDEIIRYNSSPYNYTGGVRLRTGNEMLRVEEYMMRHLQDFICPFLVLHGDDDRTVPYDAAQDLMAQSGSKDKQLVTIAGGRHQILGEPSHDELLKQISEWLLARL